MMKNILTFLALMFVTSLLNAQQLADGSHAYVDGGLKFTMTIMVSGGGDIIDEIILDAKGGQPLTGSGQWRKAPVHSDFQGEGWYEVNIDDMDLHLELDVLSSQEIKVTQYVDGVSIVMVVSKSNCKH